ncbi:hypothetical protein B0O80DRAFT_528641 [Mortierella sp. GBAus27b]|nr:hypothetical protein B0O80DRAFT_528641 [Mortierella sp. GBAus27b]
MVKIHLLGYEFQKRKPQTQAQDVLEDALTDKVTLDSTTPRFTPKKLAASVGARIAVLESPLEFLEKFHAQATQPGTSNGKLEPDLDCVPIDFGKVVVASLVAIFPFCAAIAGVPTLLNSRIAGMWDRVRGMNLRMHAFGDFGSFPMMTSVILITSSKVNPGSTTDAETATSEEDEDDSDT